MWSRDKVEISPTLGPPFASLLAFLLANPCTFLIFFHGTLCGMPSVRRHPNEKEETLRF